MRKLSIHPVTESVAAALIVSFALAAAWSGVAHARDRKADTCLANLRRLGMASRMYSDDYDGYLVPYAVSSPTGGSTYSRLLLPYLPDRSAFACPADHLDRSHAFLSPAPTTYGVNWYLSKAAGTFGPSAMSGARYKTIKVPSHTVWAADSAVITGDSASLSASNWKEDLMTAPTAEVSFFYLPNEPNTGASQTGSWSAGGTGTIVRPFGRHGGRVNTAFYDGHAASVPASSFDPKFNPDAAWGKPGCIWDNVGG
jgi:prepilin-type processing-associated H-X9-DG protein